MCSLSMSTPSKKRTCDIEPNAATFDGSSHIHSNLLDASHRSVCGKSSATFGAKVVREGLATKLVDLHVIETTLLPGEIREVSEDEQIPIPHADGAVAADHRGLVGVQRGSDLDREAVLAAMARAGVDLGFRHD